MKQTTNYGWSYPEPGDHTRTWEYWQVFEDVDGTLRGVDAHLSAVDARVSKLEAPGSFFCWWEGNIIAPQLWNQIAYQTAWANGCHFDSPGSGQIIIDSPGLWWIFAQCHYAPSSQQGNGLGGIGHDGNTAISTENPLPVNLPGTTYAGIAADLAVGNRVYGMFGQSASTDRTMTWATLSGFRIGAAGTPPRTAPPIGGTHS